MNRTLTEEYWLLKGELAAMTRKFEEARDLIDKYIQLIQIQELQIKELKNDRLGEQGRSKRI